MTPIRKARLTYAERRWAEGFDAQQAGKSWRDCPYGVFTPSHLAWQQGYLAAEADLEGAEDG